MDVGELVLGAITVYLLWDQNRILARQGPSVPPSNWRERLGKLRRYWPLAAMVLLTIATWLPRYLPKSETFSGISDIPAGAVNASIPIGVSLPYTVHGLTTDWNATAWVMAKETGGELDWAVTPRSGSEMFKTQPVAPATVTPISRSRWLKLDDATKWHFMQWMRAAKPPQGCAIVIAHYSTSYAQGVNGEFREILDYADWQVLKGAPNEDFPNGVSVISPKSDNADPVWICAVDVQNGLRQFSDVSVPIKTIEGNAKTLNMNECANRCVEVDIGNEPEATPIP
jgi:hypothetical protein